MKGIASTLQWSLPAHTAHPCPSALCPTPRHATPLPPAAPASPTFLLCGVPYLAIGLDQDIYPIIHENNCARGGEDPQSSSGMARAVSLFMLLVVFPPGFRGPRTLDTQRRGSEAKAGAQQRNFLFFSRNPGTSTCSPSFFFPTGDRVPLALYTIHKNKNRCFPTQFSPPHRNNVVCFSFLSTSTGISRFSRYSSRCTKPRIILLCPQLCPPISRFYILGSLQDRTHAFSCAPTRTVVMAVANQGNRG